MLVHSACEWSGNELISTCISTGRGGWLWLRQLMRESVMSGHDFFFFFSEGSGETPNPSPLSMRKCAHTHTHNPSIPTLFNLERHQRLPSRAHQAERDVSLTSESRYMKMFNFLPVRQPGALCPFSNLINQNTSFSRFVSLAFILCNSALLVQTASPHRTPPYRRRASESWGYWDDKSSLSAGFAGGIFLTDDG